MKDILVDEENLLLNCNPQMSNTNLLIAGSIALDTIETAYGKQDDVLGGSVTYALHSAQLFCPCSVVGIIGTDFPKAGRDYYQEFATNLDDLQEVAGATFRWGGRYSENWENRETLFTELGVFEDFTPKLTSDNQNVNTVLLANIHPVLQQEVIDQCNAELIILDTMNLWINTTRQPLEKVLDSTSILLVNKNEATLLTGISEPEKAGQELLKHGLDKVVVKRGDKGAILVEENKLTTIGAYPVDHVVDPTGAGDVFAGALAGVLHSGGSIHEALIQASALASICVEGFGIEQLKEHNKEDVLKRTDYLEKTLNL